MSQLLAKTSYLPARLIESVTPTMKRRGRLQVNAYADITLFDPEKVTGVAGYKSGTNSLPSKGFKYVLVTGTVVVKEGVLVEGVFPGEPIRSSVAKTL